VARFAAERPTGDTGGLLGGSPGERAILSDPDDPLTREFLSAVL
jgi:hypothetical protein